MNGVFDEDIAMALELIAENGQVCDWHKDVTTLGNEDRPWLGGETATEVLHPSICFLPATDGASGFGITKFRRPGDDIPSFSTFGLMGAVDFEPLVTDKVMRDGVPLVIVAIDKLKPNEQTLLYILSIA
jgi:hypothetical protein